MTKSFFQSLERFGVSYLLISGQATVLYGASAFSEDIDLWVRPSVENIEALMAALRSVKASYYKLTPEMNVELMEKGHGFHFLVGEEIPDYIDVLGRPPRVGIFEGSKATSTIFDTEWGSIPVIGLKDLVEVKKTQRIQDYSIISKLAIEWLDRPECSKTAEDFRWAIENIFTLEQLETFSRRWGQQIAAVQSGAIQAYMTSICNELDPPSEIENEIVSTMQTRMQDLQQSDRAYWREIIAELRQLKAENRLMPNGAPV